MCRPRRGFHLDTLSAAPGRPPCCPRVHAQPVQACAIGGRPKEMQEAVRRGDGLVTHTRQHSSRVHSSASFRQAAVCRRSWIRRPRPVADQLSDRKKADRCSGAPLGRRALRHRRARSPLADPRRRWHRGVHARSPRASTLRSTLEHAQLQSIATDPAVEVGLMRNPSLHEPRDDFPYSFKACRGTQERGVPRRDLALWRWRAFAHPFSEPRSPSPTAQRANPPSTRRRSPRTTTEGPAP